MQVIEFPKDCYSSPFGVTSIRTAADRARIQREHVETERRDMPKSVSDHLKNDADRGKGSQEPDERGQAGNNSMTDQLGHRGENPMQDGADSDFPEPGQSPEHSFEGEFKKTG